MFMIELRAFTALLVTPLASWVARSASVVAMVASATLAVPAAACSERLVALLVVPLSASIACPRMFWNEPVPVALMAPTPLAAPEAPTPGAWALASAIELAIEGMGAIGGIIIMP